MYGFHRDNCRSDCIDQLDRKVATDTLPDEVLFHTFYFYVNQTWDEDAWHTLVHVCQQWRYVVFASPKRLNLRLHCTHGRAVKNMLDVWPLSLPIVISDHDLHTTPPELEGAKIFIAALKHRDRISAIDLQAWLWEPIVAMTEPFPVLTSLRLHSWAMGLNLVLPDSFMGGSCPRLQVLHLDEIPFPGVGKLLLSTSDLTGLYLQDIPYSGYIAPEAMITYLSTLTKLESFDLGFRSPRSRAKRANRRPPTVTRIVLAALTEFQFKGDSAYLEEIVSRIDAPLLDTFTITFFDCLVLDTPQLRHFISHTEKFTALHRADVLFHGDYHDIGVTFSPSGGLRPTDRGTLTLGVLYADSGPGFMSLVRLCSSAWPPLPTLERLSALNYVSSRQPRIAVTEWVEFLRVFIFVKDLDLFGGLSYQIMNALRELAGEGVIEVLPALQNIFVHELWTSDDILKSIEPFVAARQLSGHPVAVHRLK